jgi:hypothetical protein
MIAPWKWDPALGYAIHVRKIGMIAPWKWDPALGYALHVQKIDMMLHRKGLV